MGNSKYSLILKTNDNRTLLVNIPKLKEDNYHSKIGGYETYQMAIDNYTIQFKDKNELLNDIRNQGYASIKRVSNDGIDVYVGFSDRDIKDDVVYSDNVELKEFLDHNNITSLFEFPSDRISKYNENIIHKFQIQFIKMLFRYDKYYESYLENQMFRKSCTTVDIIKNNKLSELVQRALYVIPANIALADLILHDSHFGEYKNIRQHFLTDYNQVEYELSCTKEQDIDFNERIQSEILEEKKERENSLQIFLDYLEISREVKTFDEIDKIMKMRQKNPIMEYLRQKYHNTKVNSNLEFLKDEGKLETTSSKTFYLNKDPFMVDFDEQMEQLDNSALEFVDYSEDEQSYKEMDTDYLDDYIEDSNEYYIQDPDQLMDDFNQGIDHNQGFNRKK